MAQYNMASGKTSAIVVGPTLLSCFHPGSHKHAGVIYNVPAHPMPTSNTAAMRCTSASKPNLCVLCKEAHASMRNPIDPSTGPQDNRWTGTEIPKAL